MVLDIIISPMTMLMWRKTNLFLTTSLFDGWTGQVTNFMINSIHTKFLKKQSVYSHEHSYKTAQIKFLSYDSEPFWIKTKSARNGEHRKFGNQVCPFVEDLPIHICHDFNHFLFYIIYISSLTLVINGVIYYLYPYGKGRLANFIPVLISCEMWSPHLHLILHCQ